MPSTRLSRTLRPLALPLAGLLGLALGLGLATPEIEELEISGFATTCETRVPGTPEEVFDLFTGDVSPWWDHSFSEEPHALRIEPVIGGRFYEQFDAEGNGAQHARVTLVHRGRELQFRGSLGFASLGVHFDMVHRVLFEAVEGGTRVEVGVRGLGEVQKGWPEGVERVWTHFLDERFRPYAEEKLGD